MRNRKIIFLFLNQSICCGYSKEPSQWDGSFEHPKHMLKIMDKKIFTLLRWNFFVYLNLPDIHCAVDLFCSYSPSNAEKLCKCFYFCSKTYVEVLIGSVSLCSKTLLRCSLEASLSTRKHLLWDASNEHLVKCIWAEIRKLSMCVCMSYESI